MGICHCFDCRKHHGALFHASAIFPQDAVTVAGETRGSAADQLTPTYESWIVRRARWLPPFPLTRRYERDREGSESRAKAPRPTDED